MTSSWPRRFTILCLVPLAASALAYLLAPLYGDQPTDLRVLPMLALMELWVIAVPAALLALVRQPALVAIAATALTTTAVFLVWTMATAELSGCAYAFAFYRPLRVGVLAAMVLVPLAALIESLDRTGATSLR